MTKERENFMGQITSLAKRRGFIFQSSEIYGGAAAAYDYGPLGVELKNNLKRIWWQKVVQERDDMVGMDAAIFMHPKTWQASGHLQSFTDLLQECKKCHKRFREDQLPDTKCPECGGDLTKPRSFNLMFKTFLGPIEDSTHQIYLRPETAQGIFVNFQNVAQTMRKKLPFGIAQIGKSFRNEITPSNFIFRTVEFEQMEIEYFVKPKEAEKYYKMWQKERLNWYLDLGIKKSSLRLRPHKPKELAHYAASCSDIEYHFPFGWGELEGIANRRDYDLKQHEQFSKKDLKYFDEDTKERFLPYIIEPSGGIDRAILAFFVNAYREEEVRGEKRVVLKFDRRLAPMKIAVLPLVRNKEKIVKKAKEVWGEVKGKWMTMYDEVGSIGRRYRRQDEIGTPYCVTIDFETLDDQAVTVRDRDSMKQERIKISELSSFFQEKLKTS